MKKIRVMIVDDHSIVRMGLAAILDLEKDLAVCGTAESGAEAVDAALRLKPDVIVMDLMMPDLDGAEATAAIRKVLPDAKILILTTFGTSRELSRAVSAGATGAVTKNIANAELVAAIHDTAEGRPRFSAEKDAACFLPCRASAPGSDLRRGLRMMQTLGRNDSSLATTICVRFFMAASIPCVLRMPNHPQRRRRVVCSAGSAVRTPLRRRRKSPRLLRKSPRLLRQNQSQRLSRKRPRWRRSQNLRRRFPLQKSQVR